MIVGKRKMAVSGLGIIGVWKIAALVAAGTLAPWLGGLGIVAAAGIAVYHAYRQGQVDRAEVSAKSLLEVARVKAQPAKIRAKGEVGYRMPGEMRHKNSQGWVFKPLLWRVPQKTSPH